jgi:hypothetical protein
MAKQKNDDKAVKADWDDVFEVYPDATEIYVVDGMPFIERFHADNRAAYLNAAVEVVNREK